jgi:hypothetical protein
VYPDELRERAVRLVREWREARGVTEGGLTAVSEQHEILKSAAAFFGAELDRKPKK